MDVKFKHGLCKCAPSNNDGYGKYAWTKGSAARLRDIPKLPDELFEMISSNLITPPTTTRATSPTIEAAPTTPNDRHPTRASRHQGSCPSPSWTTTPHGSAS
ncbi:MAG: hypothetical protein ACKPKO_21280, partial [Candidatus Fonsibacter sp.]